eukprot:COSAG02_NODE_33736_length_495_cov_1.035354_1_plen_23_part_01
MRVSMVLGALALLTVLASVPGAW